MLMRSSANRSWIHSFTCLPECGQRVEVGVIVETLAGEQRYFGEAVYRLGWGLPRGHRVVVWRPMGEDSEERVAPAGESGGPLR
jgi:hypothetical protein